MKAREGVEVWLYSFFNNDTSWSGWSEPRRGHLTAGNNPVPFVQGPGWATHSFSTSSQNLAATGFRSPDRPARSESLYRLNNTGSQQLVKGVLRSEQACKPFFQRHEG